jgi:hypothetical protein
MTVGTMLQEAFHRASAEYPELAAAWVKISFRVGSRLPQSALVATLQRDGQVDVLLRCIEDELAAATRKNQSEKGVFVFHYMNTLASYWLGGMYETCRLLRERKLAEEGDLFAAIFHKLELVRMPLEKHEIAKDKGLKQPLQMQRQPPNNDDTDLYLYDPEDQKRAHIMPMGASDRGSVMWKVIDLKNQSELWVERRAISDQVLELWSDKPT